MAVVQRCSGVLYWAVACFYCLSTLCGTVDANEMMWIRFFERESDWLALLQETNFRIDTIDMSDDVVQKTIQKAKGRAEVVDVLRLRFQKADTKLSTSFFLDKSSADVNNNFQLSSNFTKDSKSMVLGVGDIRANNNDDFNITLTAQSKDDFVQVRAIGVHIMMYSKENRRENLTCSIINLEGQIIGRHKFLTADNDKNGQWDNELFLGVITNVPLYRLLIDDPRGGADLAISKLLFGTAERDIFWPYLSAWLVLPTLILALIFLEVTYADSDTLVAAEPHDVFFDTDGNAKQEKLRHASEKSSRGGGLSFRTSLFCWLGWMAVCALLAITLSIVISWQAGLMFTTILCLEELLSFDNLFVFFIIFTSLSLPPTAQQKVLLYGIATSFFLRMAMLYIGMELLLHIQWLSPVCGLLLIGTGLKMMREEIRKGGGKGDSATGGKTEDESQKQQLMINHLPSLPSESNVSSRESERNTPEIPGFLVFLSKYSLSTAPNPTNAFCLRRSASLPVADKHATAASEGLAHGIVVPTRKYASLFCDYEITGVFLALVGVLGSNILFSLDSIPVVLSVTANLPLLVSAELLALLSMRSLFGLIVQLNSLFIYVPHAVALILVFIGGKLLTGYLFAYEISPVYVLLFVFSTISGSIGLSLVVANKLEERRV